MDKPNLTPKIWFNPIVEPRNILQKSIIYAPAVLIVSTFANPIPAAIAAISNLVISTISNLVTDIAISNKKTSLKTKKIFLKIQNFIQNYSLFLVTIPTYIIAAVILGLSFSTTCLSLLAFLGLAIAFALIIFAIRYLLIIITNWLLSFTENKYSALSKLIALPAFLAFSSSSGERFKDYLKPEKS